MPSWFWVISPIVGVVSYFLILKLQKVSQWVAVLVGIAEAGLTYILSVKGFELRVHPETISLSTVILPTACAVLMFLLFFIKGKPK